MYSFFICFALNFRRLNTGNRVRANTPTRVRISFSPPLVNNTNPETKSGFVLFFSDEYFGIRVDLDGKKRISRAVNRPAISMHKKCLYKKTYNIRWTFFRNRDNKNSPVFCLLSPRCSAVKSRSNREKLSPKTLIITRARLAVEFGSCFIYATILSFFVDFGEWDFNPRFRLLFPALPRLRAAAIFVRSVSSARNFTQLLSDFHSFLF